MRSAAPGALVLVLLVSAASAQTIDAKQVDAKTIRVTAPGRFETDFTLRKGFGHTWFDLKHDPEKKHDLAPVANENGFFWIKAGFPEGIKSGSYYANPSQSIELIEANPVRARIRLKGVHMRYGNAGKGRDWPALPFELTWTIYPTGHIFGDYHLAPRVPVDLHHFLAIIKSTGHWGKRGTGVGKDEIHSASEAGDGVKPNRQKPCAWVLQHSNGPTHFTDILMVFQDGKYDGTYWDGGYEDKDYRTGLNILSMFSQRETKDGKVRVVWPGSRHIPVMFRIADDMNDVKTAALYANDYRSPDKVGTGGYDGPHLRGDHDHDGYNESEGCYVTQNGPAGVRLMLHAKDTPRMSPVFKVIGWKRRAPLTITLGTRTLAAGRDFNASAKDGVLLLQLLTPVTEDALLVIK